MFTLFFILLAIVYIVVHYTPDTKESRRRNEDISKLPKIYIKSKPDEHPKLTKFMFDYSMLIDSFLYENEWISVVMKDGTSIKASLDDITVHYVRDAVFKYLHINIEVKGQKIHIINQPVLLSPEECDVITNIFSLAGKTYGASMFSSFNKGVSTVNSILKILKALQ